MFALPSLKDLMERSRQSFRANLPGSDAWVWPNNIYASAKVIAGMTFEVFGFADYISRQKFALTADSEHLDMHGAEFGMARRPAQPARGEVKLTSSGALTVAAGAIFTRADDVQYRAVLGGDLVSAGTLTVEAVSTTDGQAVSSISGTPLAITQGVTGDALAEVGTNAIVGGADVEDDETFRARILFRKRNTPHSGAPADYVMWAMSVPGVSRVFVERRFAGPGSVRVFPLMDDLYANGIAPFGEIARVADYIDAVAPAATEVVVSAPTAVPVDVTIEGLSPNASAIREEIEIELRAAFRRLSRVAGGDIEHPAMPYLAYPSSFSRSWIWQTVANSAGETRHKLIAPAADVTLSAGQIATLGTVSFV